MAKKKGLFDTLNGGPSYGGVSNKILHPKAPKPKPSKPNAKAPSTKPPSTAPPGSYDPALDAQGRASGRGVEQLQQDVGLANQRGAEDRATAVGLATRNSERQQADFQTRLDDIFHSFAIQGRQQMQSANSAGVEHGGTLEAAAQVRQGNEQRAEAPIHTAQGREKEDLAARLMDINRTADRANQDRATKLSRGVLEGGIYKSDIEAEKLWQAQQNNPDLLAQLAGSGKSGKKGKGKKGKTPTTPPSGQTSTTTTTTTPKPTKPKTKKKGK